MTRSEVFELLPKVRRGLLLCVIAGVPLLFLRNLNDPINVPKLSLLIAGVALAAGIRGCEWLEGTRNPDDLKRLWIPAVAIAAPLTVAWALSPYRGWSFFGTYPRFTGLLPYLVVILFGMLVADSFAGRVHQIVWALTISAVGVGLYALIQRVGLDPFEWALRDEEFSDVTSTLGNTNFVGGFFAMVLPLFVGLWVREAAYRRWIVPMAAVVAAGWIVSVSQNAWLAGTAGVCVAAAFTIASRWRVAPKLAYIAAGFLAVVVAGSVIAAMTDVASLGSTIEKRGQWWDSALEMAAESPVVGRGPSTFALEHPRYRTPDTGVAADFRIPDDPHSMYLAFLTGGGALALIGLLVALVWIFRRGMATARDDAFAAAFFGAVVAYAIQMLATIDTVALRTTFWASVGGLVCAPLQNTVRQKRGGSAKSKRNAQDSTEQLVATVGMAVVALIALTGAWFGLRITVADARFQQGLALLSEGKLEQAEMELEASEAARGEVYYRRLHGSELGQIAVAAALDGEEETGRQLFSHSRREFTFIDDVPHSNSVVDFARLLRDWGSANPESGAVELGFVADAETKKEALETYERATDLDPFNPVLLQEAADLALAMDEYEIGRGILEPRAALVEVPGVWGRLALLLAELGETDAARSAVEKALAGDPAQEQALKAEEIISG